MASALLQLNPEDRVGAENGLLHPYFATLPKKLYELPDGELRLFKVRKKSHLLFTKNRNINLHCRRRVLVSGAES